MKWKYETWRKLYTSESPSFAQLPLYARALGAELLKICDGEGRIHLSSREPADAIAFALGATKQDRALLRAHLPLLLKDQYLVKADGYLVIRNFRDAQLKYDRIRVEKLDDVKPTSGEDPEGIRPTSGGLPSDLRPTSGGLAVGDDKPNPAKTISTDRRSVPSPSETVPNPSSEIPLTPLSGGSVATSAPEGGSNDKPADDSPKKASKPRKRKAPAERKYQFTLGELAGAFGEGALERAALGAIDDSLPKRLWRVVGALEAKHRDLTHVRLAGEFMRAHPFERPAGTIGWDTIAQAGWLLCRIDAAIKWNDAGRPIAKQGSLTTKKPTAPAFDPMPSRAEFEADAAQWNNLPPEERYG